MSQLTSRSSMPLALAAFGCLVVIALSLACSSPKYEALPPQSVTSGPGPSPVTNEGFATPESRDAGVSESPDAAAETPTPAGDEAVVVVEGEIAPAEAVLDRRSELLRASQAERKRRATAPPPVLVITDENLSELARGARLTIGGVPAKTEIDDSPASAMSEEETYWRQRVRDLRLEWRDAYDSIAELEAQAADLRTRFYAQDDPAYRDRVIKPEWDRVLDRLDQARRTVERAQEELDFALEEGGRAGALPGWLREGIELEPLVEEPEDEREPQTTDPQEPKVVEPPPGGPR